jgi:hypothetical protein
MPTCPEGHDTDSTDYRVFVGPPTGGPPTGGVAD